MLSATIKPINATLTSKLMNNYYKEKYTLFTHVKYACLLIPGNDLGELQQVIGFLREKLYSEQNKGSGKEYDLDGRDAYYHHVLIWDNERQSIVAGCRIMPSFAIKESQHSYLEYSFPGLYHQWSNHFTFVEMGRAFVTKSYQKNYSSFLLLSRVVHAFCKKNQLRHLVGLASYNPDKYDFRYNQILINSLKNSFFMDASKPIPNPRFSLNIGLSEQIDQLPDTLNIKSMRELATLLSSHTENAEKIPVLIRQYIEGMRAKVLGFAQARGFNNAVEILVCVDLEMQPSYRLQKFS